MDPDKAVLNLQIGFEQNTEDTVQVAPSGVGWAFNRKYGIVIDAGSSGSRVQIYSWVNPSFLRQNTKFLNKTLPHIEKGDEKGEQWQMKEEPGISSFAVNPQAVTGHLKPLLDFAMGVIPKSKHASTPIYLLATAGMRLITDEARASIMGNSCRYVGSKYPFAISGGCDRHFRVISGELEGIYGWLTVNYLKNGFDTGSTAILNTTRPSHVAANKHTFGFLDMGGASTQIAFEPTAEMAALHGDDLTQLKLRFLDGAEVTYRVFVTTFLGFGVNEARRRYLASLVQQLEKPPNSTLSTPTSSLLRKSETRDTQATHRQVVAEPCLQSGLTLEGAATGSGSALLYNGTGDFETCLSSLLPLLNKALPCPELPCLFNGVHAPVSDALHFLGVSEYWYTASDVFGLGGHYDHAIFLSSTQDFCRLSWSEIVHGFEAKTWPSVKDLNRLQLQCFKAAWILTVLHEGLGVPKDMVRNPADSDDAGPPVAVIGEGASDGNHFESVNEIGAFSVSWTLGAMLLHVAATIPTVDRIRSEEQNGPSPSAPGLSGRVTLVVVGAACFAVLGCWWRNRRTSLKAYKNLRSSDISWEAELADIEMEGGVA
ncbi:Golgi apyrase [Thoreauomyces humboldtii]|nr:Golgi apyrase [Thoreauomyces humboldtii]